MDLEIKTTEPPPPQIWWTEKIFRWSSLKLKHSCSSTTLDDVNDECCPIVNPANTDPNYQNLQDGIVNHGIYRFLAWKPRRKQEVEYDEVAVEDKMQRCSRKLLNRMHKMNEKWNSKMEFFSKQLMLDGLLHLIEPQVSGNDGQAITGAVEKPSVPKILLYGTLTVSSSILCLLPRIYGNKIPNLFLPHPWLFYGFNFALMLAAAASLVSIDTMSNIPKVTRSFSDLAVISLFAALALFLFSSELWALSL